MQILALIIIEAVESWNLAISFQPLVLFHCPPHLPYTVPTHRNQKLLLTEGVNVPNWILVLYGRCPGHCMIFRWSIGSLFMLTEKQRGNRYLRYTREQFKITTFRPTTQEEHNLKVSIFKGSFLRTIIYPNFRTSRGDRPFFSRWFFFFVFFFPCSRVSLNIIKYPAKFSNRGVNFRDDI